MSESRKSPSFVRCTVCGTHFSIASGGSDDVKGHVEGRRHAERAVGQPDRDGIGDDTTAILLLLLPNTINHILPLIALLNYENA